MKSLIKRRLSFALSLMMITSSLSYADDISGHWAKDKLTKWQEQGLLKGDEKGNLNPNNNITRAEFITLINKVMQYQSQTGDKIKQYQDVKENDWYYSQIMTALEKGYINGTSSTTISPKNKISRQEVMVILNNIANLKQSNFDLSPVKDQEDISNWAKTAVQNMIANGYISGYDGSINPKSDMKRAEAVVLLDAYKQNNRTISFSGKYDLGQVNKLTITVGDVVIENTKVKELILSENVKGKVELNKVEIEKITNNSKQVQIYQEGKIVEIKDGKIVVENTDKKTAKYKDGKYTGKAKGYKSDIEVEVEIKDDKIVNITVKQEEDPIYWNAAKKVIDRIIEKQDSQVDASSGATISSKAIMYAVQEALDKALIKKEEVKPGEDYKDGTYIGESNGFSGIVKVEVTIKDKKIEEVKVISHSDDAPYMESAKNLLKEIKKKQSAKVQAISGATFSSNGIINAVKDALEQALGKTTAPGKSEYATRNMGGGGGGGGKSPSPINNTDFSNLKDGVYEGEAQGYKSIIKVKVTVSGGVITAIELLQQNETPSYFDAQKAQTLAQRIIDKKSTKVDTISGATVSSNAFINAVVNALNQADKPLSVTSNRDATLKEQDEQGKTYNSGTINGQGNTPNVKLANAKIVKDLIIKDSIREGEVTLENVTVDGNLIIQGGGDNSINLANCTINNIIIDKQLGERVNLEMDASTTVKSTVTVKTPAKIKTDGSNKIPRLELPAVLGKKAQTIIQAQVATMNVNTNNADIVLENGSKIDTLILPSSVGEYSKNKSVYTNSEGFKIEIKDPNSVINGISGNTTSKTLYGDSNVDQVEYPQVQPFIHPPFYNIRVKVVVDASGKIIEVADNGTGVEGLPNGVQPSAWSRHRRYWNRMIEANYFDKYVGKTLEQVKSMQVRKGEVDSVAGATANTIAVKEAVINAFEGKQGRKFLDNAQTLTATLPEFSQGTTNITFSNTLPSGFDLKLLSVSQGIYNEKNIISGANLSQDGTALTVPSNLKAGHYFVNIVDNSKTYRSPDFESGHGSGRHYPYFIIKSNATLGFDTAKNSLTVSDGDLANVYDNVEHIIIKETSKIGTTITGGNGQQVPYTGTEIEPIGHHGTAGTPATALFDENTGKINGNVKTGRRQTPLFVNGVKYTIEVKAFGYDAFTFTYTANDTDKILEGDADVDQLDYPLIKTFIHPPFFNARVRVVMGTDGKIVSVSDNDTATKGLAPGANPNTWNARNKGYWDTIINAKYFDKFKGKTREQVEAMQVNTGEVDSVAGATANARAIKKAVLNAIDGKAGKKFLANDETLSVTTSPILLQNAPLSATTDVILTNTLPVDFDIELKGVVSGIYNSATDNISGVSLSDNGTKLTIPANLEPGHYYINIIDRSEKYRSPNFETGGGRHYPYFIIKNNAILSYADGKISVSDGDLDNIFNNIEEIIVKDKSLIGEKVPGRGGALVDYSGTAIEPVGHHGTVDQNAKTFFSPDGTINKNFQSRNQNIFVSGKQYEIEVHVFGFEQPLKFDFSV